MPEQKREQHNQLQKEYFDQRSAFFVQEIPVDVQERIRGIVSRAGVGAGSRILDVGTGAGVLIGYFLTEGVKPTDIVGCDLSAGMLTNARARFPSVYFLHGDFLAKTDRPPDFPKHLEQFDFVFFNACFANMLDRKQTLEQAASFLNRSGKIVISHPAPQFVDLLHESDPLIVPHLLPTRNELMEWSLALALELVDYESQELLYFAALKKL